MTGRRGELLDATITVIARRGVRGLRVQEVAAEAGVSVPLIYHYFGSRDGLLTAALAAVDDRAGRYSARSVRPGTTAREELTARLLGELQDDPEVRTTSGAWGELRWASVFDEALRPPVAALTAAWVDEVAGLVRAVRREEPGGGPDERDARDVAELLVALVEGLSGRWLTGAAELPHLHDLLRRAVEGLLPPAHPRRSPRAGSDGQVQAQRRTNARRSSSSPMDRP